MRRPLFLVVLFYTTGILLAGLFSISIPWLFLSAFAMVLTTLLWTQARAYLLGPLVLIAGWTHGTLHTAVLSPKDLRRILGADPALASFRGYLVETPSLRMFIQDEKESWRSLAQIEVRAVRFNKQSWQPASGRIAVTTPGQLTNFFGGQTVEVFGVAHVPRIAAAEGLFDYRAYLRQKGIHYQLDAASDRDWQIISGPTRPPLADRFRSWGRAALARGLPGEDASLRLEWALTLGWKPALTEELCEPFVRAATYHIFAVDGLRMAILFGIGFGLLRALRIPRGICGLLLLPLIWFYTALTGWPASAIRANVMLTIIILGWILKRPTDLLNSLFAAAWLILLWDPGQIYQAGFQLSFCVVLVLILCLKPLRGLGERFWRPDPLLPDVLRPRWQLWLRVPCRHMLDLILTSFAAWIGSIPLVAYYFHIVTPISTPANLLAVPLCGLVLISDLASLLVASWCPGMSILFNHAGWFLMESIRVTSEWFATWPRAYAYVKAPTLFTSVLYYLLLLALITGWLFKPRLRVLRFSTFGFGSILGAWVLWIHAQTPQLHVVPVHGGIAVLWDAPGFKDDLLADCGATNSVSMITKPFLRAQGINRLARFILTHGDIRHVGGAEMLTRIFPIDQVCVSPVRFRSSVYRRLVNGFQQKPERLRVIQRGDSLGPWKVLHPSNGDHFPQADDNSVVLSGEIQGTRVLLVSDLGRLGQKALLQRSPDLRADIVITGLPAQSEALTDEFLETIRPELIIVADSEYPVWERASTKLSQRLAQLTTPVIYTRATGAVTLEWHGTQWRIRDATGQPVQPALKESPPTAPLLQNVPIDPEPD